MLLDVLLILWLITTVIIIIERRAYRNIIYFGVFSLIASLCYFLLGAPDVAMAEAGISIFATIFIIVCMEKQYGSKIRATFSEKPLNLRDGAWIKKIAVPLVLSIVLFALTIHFMPDHPASTYLKDFYLRRFSTEVGGQNAVTAILFGYRVYDTLFEALILVVSVLAVTHLSWAEQLSVSDGHHSRIEKRRVTAFTLRVMCPLTLTFGVYLILNGHIAAGGGFLGGLSIAYFFVCRYFICGIYDIKVKNIMLMEEVVFISFAVMSAVFVGLLGVNIYLPTILARFDVIYQNMHLIVMNSLIGIKVACGFFIIFYRYVAVERDKEST